MPFNPNTLFICYINSNSNPNLPLACTYLPTYLLTLPTGKLSYLYRRQYTFLPPFYPIHPSQVPPARASYLTCVPFRRSNCSSSNCYISLSNSQPRAAFGLLRFHGILLSSKRENPSWEQWFQQQQQRERLLAAAAASLDSRTGKKENWPPWQREQQPPQLGLRCEPAGIEVLPNRPTRQTF